MVFQKLVLIKQMIKVGSVQLDLLSRYGEQNQDCFSDSHSVILGWWSTKVTDEVYESHIIPAGGSKLP